MLYNTSLVSANSGDTFALVLSNGNSVDSFNVSIPNLAVHRVQ